jgi:hypothetical protein
MNPLIFILPNIHIYIQYEILNNTWYINIYNPFPSHCNIISFVTMEVMLIKNSKKFPQLITSLVTNFER